MVNEGGGAIDRQVPVPAPLPGSADGKPARRGLIWRLFHRRERLRSLEVRWCNGEIAFGRSPTIDELERLARRHHLRSLLNLNTEGEVGEVMSPNVEASWAETFELAHRRVSIDTALLKPADADRFPGRAAAHRSPCTCTRTTGAARGVPCLLARRGAPAHGQRTLAEAGGSAWSAESDALREFFPAK
jgi:hypothetical protein